ncbi:MAG: hypothetical protein C0467_16175 [Planctomycetaceae bacterium]|nr:hypothetical protein [Planctomycetaceae bacterium]
MVRDAEKKKTLLHEWLVPFLPTRAVRILDSGSILEKASVQQRLSTLSGNCPNTFSIYVLFSETTEGLVPVYIGKADQPLVRWGQHLDGWLAGSGVYGGWRRALLDDQGKARTALTLLVVPGTDITRPPIPGFPTTVGAVEYQLVGLAGDAYPGRLLNHEGVGR